MTHSFLVIFSYFFFCLRFEQIKSIQRLILVIYNFYSFTAFLYSLSLFQIKKKNTIIQGAYYYHISSTTLSLETLKLNINKLLPLILYNFFTIK